MIAYADTLKSKLALALATQASDALDIGCGLGRVTIPLASICRSVVGVDTDVKRVALVSSKLAPYPSTSIHVASAERLPFRDASFDLVVCYSTLPIVSNPLSAISEIRRVMRPHGRAIIELHGSGNPNYRFWREYYKKEGMILHGYRLSEAQCFLTENGLSIERCIANGWTRGALYLPVLKNMKFIEPLIYSGREPDWDHVLSNLRPMLPFASSWYFVVSSHSQ